MYVAIRLEAAALLAFFRVAVRAADATVGAAAVAKVTAAAADRARAFFDAMAPKLRNGDGSKWLEEVEGWSSEFATGKREDRRDDACAKSPWPLPEGEANRGGAGKRVRPRFVA